MVKQRGFSLYDVEQYLKEAGAQKINEKAVISLEQELEQTVKELVGEASFYARYAGRSNIIRGSDVTLARQQKKSHSSYMIYQRKIKRKHAIKKRANSGRIVLRRVKME